MGTRVDINTDLLTWAIQRAGYEVDAFLLDYPKVQAWLDQKKQPTVRQLEDFAHRVHIPFGYLLLREPPVQRVPIPYFRTQGGLTDTVSLNVYETVNNLQRRQDWLVSYLEEQGADPLVFVGKYSVESGFQRIVSDIRETLQLSEDWATSQSGKGAAINVLTERVEAAGIITSFSSYVGSQTQRKIPLDECRGFVLVHPLAPFLFVNSADAKSAQLFTLLHELAHIWIGKSAGFDNSQLLPANDPEERLCDQVAAEFLVPAELFRRNWAENSSIKKLARMFKVSPIVIARRALDLGEIDKNGFFGFYNAYRQELRDIKTKRKERKNSGGDYYATARRRVSPTFAAYIHQAVKENNLLYRDAYRLTGLSGNTFQEFMSKSL
ncbi:MAG TPA: ImmA/IrrE family metallo-endopeptidase [Phaeodactylibacter sp.]|nr:ImmA/IrrE family metallo-endopeptidase [Phaeodactylibacter sp.]